MIGCINGDIIDLSAPSACLLTVSGVGYDVEFPVPDFCQLSLATSVQIWTHMVVREDVQLLYGFLDKTNRDVFRQLIKINGVGAKMALAMLSNLSVTELKQCVADKNEATLVRIPGIGKKTAQRLLIELEGKLAAIKLDELPLSGDSNNLDTLNHNNENDIHNEAKSALLSLGYKEKEAEQAIKLCKKEFTDHIEDTQTLLKMALKQLSKY